ncbi:MAG: PilZ domain-containing protein [Oscillospiraceae bacterium]|nr:PilZ domain-containing protein [Oscillospiraceae bacterium]
MTEKDINDIYGELNSDIRNNDINNIYISDGGDEIDIILDPDEIITVSDCQSRLTPDPSVKYVGKFLRKTDDSLLILGICAEKRQGIEYKAGDRAAVSYKALRSHYSFNVKITDIREVMPEDDFDTRDMLNELTSIHGYNNYIFEVFPVSQPEKQHRREFFRMPLRIEVYYKLIPEYIVDNMTMTDLKFEHELAAEKKKDADEGLLEKEEGFSKLFTLDFSAGGFKCRYPEKIAVNTYLYCMLIIDGEALPVIGRVVRSKADEDEPSVYDLHVSFCKISDPVRDRLFKYIFYQQRQTQAKFLKKRF